MGINDQKFCKVTVHRTRAATTLDPKPWENHGSSSVRSTIAYRQPSPRNPKAPTEEELKRWTATGSAAIDGLELPSRRRAHTTTATMDMEPFSFSSRGLDPLLRMTLRMEQDPTASATAEEEDGMEMTVRSDSFLQVDTDGTDPVRETFDEESKMFVPGTPPIPTGLTVDMLPTADFTPEIPSEIKRALDLDTVKQAAPQAISPRQSRIRISSPSHGSQLSSIFGDFNASLTTPMLSSSAGTPLEDYATAQAFEQNNSMSQAFEQNIGTAATSFVPVSSYADVHLSEPKIEEPQPEVLDQPEPEIQVEDEQLFDTDEPEDVSSFIEVSSEAGDDVAMDIDETAFDVCDNFDAILGEPLPNRSSRWRFSIVGQKMTSVRQKRGMSSPPRMIAPPPVPALARHTSVPSSSPPASTQPSIRQKPIVHAPEGEPLYHGQMLHLAFKASTGHTVQVSTQQRRSKSNLFSKLVDCFSADNEPFADVNDALRIIGHTSDSEIRGGDRISLARGDGSVLRIQKMSKKLGFSPKIDLKAKFVVCGVPEGTVVTDTTKFYLQSVYDRTKTIGFLKDRRHPGHGCLVMYAYRTTGEKSEPIQFFKRPSGPSFSQLHAAQQGRALPAASPMSPVAGGFM